VPPYLVCDGILLSSALNGAILSAVKERFLRSGVLILIGLVTGCPGGVDRETVGGTEPNGKCVERPDVALANRGVEKARKGFILSVLPFVGFILERSN